MLAGEPALLELLLQLAGFGALLGSQRGVKLGESLGPDCNHLAEKTALPGRELLNGSIAIARFGRVCERLAVLLQLFADRLRRLASLLKNCFGLLFLVIGQVELLRYPRHALADQVMRPCLWVGTRRWRLREHHSRGQGRNCCEFN